MTELMCNEDGIEPIYDRSKEHLGTTDAMVITARRLMIKSAKAHRDHGTLPPNVMNVELDACSASVILPAGADWVEATEAVRSSDGGQPVAYVIRREALANRSSSSPAGGNACLEGTPATS